MTAYTQLVQRSVRNEKFSEEEWLTMYSPEYKEVFDWVI
jgi:hypothetical protein